MIVTILLFCILLVLVGGVGYWIWSIEVRGSLMDKIIKDRMPEEKKEDTTSKSLEELVKYIRERMERDEMEKRDEELRKMGFKNIKGKPGEFRVSNGDSGPVRSGKEYIPYNLSDRDKEILRMFNES